MRTLVSYMRTTDPVLSELSVGLDALGVTVDAVLCHSGERDAARAQAMWPGAHVATHGINFISVTAADADVYQALPADLLARLLPVAERSISPLRAINVSQLVQVIGSEYRRAAALVRRARPQIGIFLAQRERLLDYFVHMILTTSGVPCVNLRKNSTSNGVCASLSAEAPLLATYDSLAFETISLQRGTREAPVADFGVGGVGIADVISRSEVYRRKTRAYVTTNRVRRSLARVGETLQGVGRKPRVSYHLHLEPEATVYPANGFRSNQLNNIALLSEWLDGHAEVVVKEHPVLHARGASLPYAVRNRNRAFYTAVSQLPNVTLLNLGASMQYSLDQSAIVATVGGSVGWEALSAGIPVIHFGHSSYANAVGAHRWQSDLTLTDILTPDKDVIADCAAVTRELLARHSYPVIEMNRRIGRARAVMAAVESILAETGHSQEFELGDSVNFLQDSDNG